MFTAEATAAEITGIVREAIQARRGASLKAAQAEVARLFGISFRRARSYWEQSVRSIPSHEADRIRARQSAALELRLRKLETEREALWARLRALGCQ